ncbi:hypothetical protein KPSA1B_102259 [Pseudomonas syringae pv. actinidiae]|uniref:Phosphohistidine phosphatase SixA n=1 Tax=Pseudomonas syringae pv. actinidiae TaxID=103796 RepID=A0A2V0Q7U2_PSESF|nr:hypothetical protein KPSA1B_102259 [Pseudomonas syringae pv. actinidiae]GBH08457.1 Phosphohistidine phosphatase SixA [Pseudomonas syringae pv. actinidiae]
MVSIYVCGEDKTRQISNWVIKKNVKGEFDLAPEKRIPCQVPQ